MIDFWAWVLFLHLAGLGVLVLGMMIPYVFGYLWLYLVRTMWSGFRNYQF